MNFLLRNVMDRFDLLSVRERVLILVAALAVVVVVWETGFSAPRELERKQRTQVVQSLRAEVKGLEQSIATLAEQADQDPDRTLNEEIASLRKELPQLEARLAGATTGLIGPEEMTEVLRQLLKRADQLEVRSLRTLAAVPVMDEARELGVTPGARIYKHGLELELSGNYLGVLHFLQAMESLQWRFFWDRLELQVEQHPKARIRLVVYTLSLDEGWIGV